MTTMKRYVSTLFLAILALPFFLPHTFADTPITTAIDNSSAKTYISYYDSSNLPSSIATNTSDSWVTTTVDSNGTVGKYTSIALDSSGKAHISYIEDSSKNFLKYATNASGSWITKTVDSLGNHMASEGTSIALDSSGKAHISYMGRLNLKYATNASGSWVKKTLDRSGSSGWFSSIALDSSDKAHISYGDSHNHALKYATNASGSWVKTTVDTGGGSTSIAIDPSNKAHISYGSSYLSDDGYRAEIKYATNVSGSWITDLLERKTSWAGYAYAKYTSIALDSSGKVHISYSMPSYNGNNYSGLKYTTNASVSWITTTVDSSGEVHSLSIALDSSDMAHISYYDSSNSTLKYTTNAAESTPTLTPTVTSTP